ncbi:MAG: hypothetical protein MJZ57_04730 [Bacteroidales bacterium]|nr:hypothetical protein [Bacteroidales bacterium]
MMALCLMMFFVSCGNRHKKVELLEYNGKFPEESAENMCITMSDGGKTSFIVKTPLMNSYAGDSVYSDCPKGITAISYNESGQKQAILTADYACIINNAVYRACNNVVIRDVIKGDTLETQEIIWDQRQRTIYSNVLVKQKKADGSVNYGDGFTADERFTKYTIIHPRGEMNGLDF